MNTSERNIDVEKQPETEISVAKHDEERTLETKILLLSE